MVNQQEVHGRPRLIDTHGERRLARMDRSNRRATVAKIPEAVSNRKVSESTAHSSLFCMGLRVL